MTRRLRRLEPLDLEAVHGPSYSASVSVVSPSSDSHITRTVSSAPAAKVTLSPAVTSSENGSMDPPLLSAIDGWLACIVSPLVWVVVNSPPSTPSSALPEAP